MISKIIHTSDLHLGMTFKSLGHISKFHRVDCLDTFSKIIDMCLKEKVDGLLIAGDLFDNPEPNKSLVKYVNKEFIKLEKNDIYVFISTGNHDPYAKNSIWEDFVFPKNVIIFDNQKMESTKLKNLSVYGLAYKDDTVKPFEDFSADDEDSFKIGLVHGSTININWDEQPEAGYRPITKENINNSGLDYVALGHFHNFMNLNTEIPCFYSGSPEGLSFKNMGDKYVLLVSYDNGKVDIEKIKTNKREFKTIEIDCTNFESNNEIREIIKENVGENNILKVELKGNPSIEFNLDIDFLLKEFESKYFFLRFIDNIHIPNDLTEDETIRGTFIKVLREEIKNENDENRKKRLENALRIGIAHLDKKL